MSGCGGGEGMRLGFNLVLQQQQKLIMTPELRQALAILQLPVVDLETYIQQELLENPVLEVKEEGDDPVVQGETNPEPAEPVDGDAELTRQWLEYFGGEHDHDPGAPINRDDDEYDGLLGGAAAPAPTLQEHLHEQLRLYDLAPEEKRAAAFLIDSLDDNGYLTLSVRDAAFTSGQPESAVERALQVVHTLDPVGVGARDLRECLLLQWVAVGDGNPLVPELIQHYLDDLAAARITRIAEALGVLPADVQVAADALRTLDPKPGRRFGRPGDTRYIVADVVVERVGREYVVLINESPVPRLMLNAGYRQLVRGGGLDDAETRRFLEGKLNSALWLIRSIEQRRLTLYRVTESIVRLQRSFFDRGLRHLKPLTLREVAGEIEMHESTVSRAIAGKYAQTPHGLFELKFFFSSGVESWGGAISAKSVKRLIRDLISAEDAREPLSDQAVAEALVKQGVQISRRTVAKYREESNIPASARRKRYES